jgi:hypothetical protein
VFSTLNDGIDGMDDKSAGWTSGQAAQRRAAGAELDGEDLDQAIIVGAVMSVAIVSPRLLETEHRCGCELAQSAVHSTGRHQWTPAFLMAE